MKLAALLIACQVIVKTGVNHTAEGSEWLISVAN